MRSLLPLTLFALAAAATGCDKGDDTEPVDTAGGGDGGEPGPATLELALDDLFGVPNLDDDDEDGEVDWEQPGLSEENDYIAFSVSSVDREALPEGHTLTLTLSGDSDDIRVWSGGELAFGAGAGEGVILDAGTGQVDYQVEFADFLAEGEITVSYQDAEGTEHDSRTFRVMAAPLILNNHTQTAEHLFVLETSYYWLGQQWSNESMIDVMQSVLGDDITVLADYDYDYDVWVQDEVEFATLTASDGHRVDLVIDSIRDGQWQPGYGLDDFPEDHVEGPDFIVMTWGEERSQSSQDSFGNLEITPPVEGYPHGRVYWGDAVYWAPAEELTDFLVSQKIQAPFILDSSFLCVGHVDEWMTWLPDPSSEKGFKLVYTDTELGWALLEGMDPELELPRYETGHGFPTVGSILEDTALRNLNTEYQEDYLDPNLDILKAELGLTDDDIIYWPGLFEEVSGCGGAGVGLIPGTANLQLFTHDDGTTSLFLPDPFLRTDEADFDADPMIAEIESTLPENSDPYWVDDWGIYHLGLGEVHCGTNVIRTPVGGWWNDSLHLLED